MHLPRPCRLVVLLAGLAPQAFAQQPETAPALARVEVSGAGEYDARRDDTASRIVVPRAEIVRYGDTSLVEVLRRLPGVTVTTGAGRAAQVRMRGLAGGYTQILVDGQRTPAGFTLDTLAPESIERIEVLRVANAEFAAESVAGTINIVLRKAGRKSSREAKLGYLLSRDFKGPTFSVEAGDRGARGAWSLSANGHHDNLEREWGGAERNTRPDGVVDLQRRTLVAERGRMNRLNIAPRFQWTLDGGAKLAWETLASSSSFRNGGDARIATLAGAPPPVPRLLTHGEYDDRMLKSDLGWNRAFGPAGKLDAKLGVQWSSRKMHVARSGQGPDGLPATEGSILTDTHARGATSTGKFTRGFAGGHLFALGWDLGVNVSDDIRVERDRVRPLPADQPAVERFRLRSSRVAFYAQDEWTIDPQWSLYLGARWEGVRTTVTGDANDGSAPVRVDSSVLSPIVQMLWKPGGAKGHQLRLGLSRTYKAQDPRSLVPRRSPWENNSATEADFQGNPGLEPELAWGLDAAWERHWAEGAMVSLSGALRRIDDYTSNRVYFDGLRWVLTPANEDRAVARSLELETKFPLKAWWPDAPALELRAAVSRHWSRVKSVPGPGNRMEQQAPLTANLGADYKRGALAAGASLAHRRGGAVRVAVNRGFYRPARTDLETYALWTFSPQRQLRLSLSNLLGEDDGFELGYADPAGGLEKRSWTYPSGPKLRATLEMKF